MGKLLNGNGSYSCFECGMTTDAPYGECPQCAQVKIQKAAAADAQRRFEQESAQREQQYYDQQTPRLTNDGGNLSMFNRWQANGYLEDSDFDDTPRGRAGLEAHRPIREKIIRERRAQEAVTKAIEHQAFMQGLGARIKKTMIWSLLFILLFTIGTLTPLGEYPITLAISILVLFSIIS